MAILRGGIPMMAFIPTNDCTVFTCAGCMRCFFKNAKTIHRMTVCLKFFEEHQIFRNTPRVKSIGYSTMAVFYTLFSIVLTFMNL